MDLCKYKNIAGKEGQGLHSVRLFNVAILDVIGTVAIGVILAKIFKWNVWLTLGALFIIAIIMHRLFCVNTTINKLIFGRV